MTTNYKDQSNSSQAIQENNQNKLDFPYLAVIPYDVMIDTDLEPNAKLHFGCLSALSKKEGYCYATDKQLAQMHGVNIAQIERWNKHLKDKKFIHTESKNITYRSNDGKLLWKKQRKIYVGNAFSNKDYDTRKNEGTNDTRKNEGLLNKESSNSKKEINKEKNASSDAEFISKYLFEDLKRKNPKQRTPNLNQWALDIDKIMRVDKRSKDDLIDVIDWASNNPNSYWSALFQGPKTLRNGFDKAYLLMNTVDKATSELIKTNIGIASKIKEHFTIKAKLKGIEIVLKDYSIEFYINNILYKAYMFNDTGFKEQIDSIMLKLKLM